MIPILYESTETQFTSNGICRLRSCSEVTVTEERNGLYECDFSYPINGENYSEIQLGRIIAVRHDDTADIQPFDIVEREAEINGIVTFHCVHISYRQAKIVAHGKNITGPSAAFNMFTDGLPNNPFSYFTDIISTKPFPLGDDVPRSVREMLGGTEGSVLDTYGGEFEWDKFDVRLWESRGEIADFSIRYGVNMTAYNDEMDSLETYSAIIPYWSGQNEQNQPVVIWGDMVTNNEVTVSGRTECVPMDFSQDFENQPTKQQLEDIALEYLENHEPTIPARTIKVEFVQTQDSGSFPEFKRLQKCRLCDSVRVVFPRYGMNGYFKIVKVTYDVLQERYTSMELGTLSTTLSEALGIGSGISGGGSSGGGGGITVLDCYPVGSYYETSDSSFDPNTAWGGTWVLDSKGRVTVGRDENIADFDTIGETGGEKTHTLTVNEMPSHSHYAYLAGGSIASGTGRLSWEHNTAQKYGASIDYTGGGQAHNNMPPYVVVNRWHRTA